MPEKPNPLNASTSRRDFAKTALAAAAAPVLAPLAACASAPQPSPSPSSASPVAAPAQPVAPSAVPQPGGGRPPDPVSIHLAEALKAKYGTRLSEAEWEEVRKGIEGNLRAAKALHDFALPIQTEPAFVFRAYRGGER
ncbi:hypothetical protein [Longimicrobium sp.]|uniref:hypothetical protein n=1 Tax=Longimicrobium sp. TaxID=2029185 RepID=UPI002CD50865|nr:hypothetical protein [Longimicrobium sp.]HSU16965.1 hypothetical protein [Longimicrobium sp.]